MPIQIKHVRKGKSEAQILVDSKKEELLLKNRLLIVGQKTLEHIQTVISQNSKEPASSNGLRNNIKLDILTNGWGIGKISELPTHWKAVNYGHSGYGIQVKNAQYLRFKDKSGKIIYRKSVKGHSISPMNFVEKSVMYLMLKLSSIK